ncbi:MAG: hypothetical protein A2782_02430 [Candidatus Blackburnbacteria bacterium RIFCSPHIGHO2_01_FULL_43_15b]|uniref:Uncharacterized protein n=1 Tax=Candidatus Blackburnbacteria bacterium RIFCSPHIGHO2_01_FULL_43_15b TaxID=1797513 RepID=A0A1G1UXW0_9BACT|nr:MAG: hypothetical protein A2782_02430 [Candidatus Blackburnbacteria bacterium RIFCSPHIGHO2_01_FULL_43_15b]
MERLPERQIFSAVERNKAASKVVKRLFPSWAGTPLHGDLQRMVIGLGEGPHLDSQAKAAGDWWLWAKDLAIDNTFTKKQQLVVLDMVISAASGKQPIHLVSARSPELLHAQVSKQGDPALPRSRKAIKTLTELARKSSELLPTVTTLVFADLAIDNWEAIRQACDVETTITVNLKRLSEICREEGLENFRWTQEQSAQHNRRLGITMGLVGQTVQLMEPSPVFCLRTLLETKRAMP